MTDTTGIKKIVTLTQGQLDYFMDIVMSEWSKDPRAFAITNENIRKAAAMPRDGEIVMYALLPEEISESRGVNLGLVKWSAVE